MNIPLREADVDPFLRHMRQRAWPKHLSPWVSHAVVDIENLPTMGPPPMEISKYAPFESVLRIMRGEKADISRPIKRPNEKLRLLLNGRKVVLAGGCIRDLYLFENPEKIKDVDVFILDCDPSDSDRILSAVAEVTYALDGSYKASADYFLDRLRAVPNNSVLNVGNVTLDISHPIQVITTTAVSVEDLLGKFDWNICRFAYDGENFWFPGWKDVALGRLTLGDNIVDPYWTMRRGVLFSEKFKGFPVRLHKQDVMLLLHMWMMNTDGKEVVGGI